MLTQTNSFNAKIAARSNGSLSAITAQKMILRLLQEAKIPKAKLTAYLDITAPELVQLTQNKAPSDLIKKISWPLVNRYCLTDFIN